jgi:hypothetical protein
MMRQWNREKPHICLARRGLGVRFPRQQLNAPRSSESVRKHLQAALDQLDLGDELDRLTNPRHTDHDRHMYLPRKVTDGVAAARREIQKAIEALG